MVEVVILQLDRNEVLLSKLNGKSFKTFGNFIKHIKDFGFTFESYMEKYYKEYLPKCICTGKPSNCRFQGYWNKWYPITHEYRKIIGKYKRYEQVNRRIDKENLLTEYLQISYWINKNYSIPESLEILHWLTQSGLYRQLHHSYYDNLWTESRKNEYINSIINLKPFKIRTPYSYEGLKDRGLDDDKVNEILNEYYKNKPCKFRDVEVQRSNNRKRQEKYSSEDQKHFSIRCVEYWLDRGYTLEESLGKVSESQKLNSIKEIQKRFNCSNEEAKIIQKEIYGRRAETFKNKSQEELDRIHKSQDSASFEYCLRKCNYDIKSATKLHKEITKKKIVPFGRASKESLKYFIPLYKFLRKNAVLREDIYFGISGSKEYYIYDEISKKIRLYDFTILSKKLIIEYDGIYWHSKEGTYESDQFKTDLCETKGFKLLRIKSEDSFEYNNKLIYEFIKDNI